MTECTNIAMRDALPDLASDSADARQRSLIEAHCDECADCRAELGTLRAVRGALSRARAVDVAAIVRALPAPPVAVAAAAGDTRVLSLDAARVRRQAVAPTRSWNASGWRRAAAAVALVAVGGASLRMATIERAAERPVSVATAPAPSTVTAPPTQAAPPIVTAPPAAVARTGASVGSGARSAAPVGLSLAGGVSDLTDNQLRSLLVALDTMHGDELTTEPAAVLPAFTDADDEETQG